MELEKAVTTGTEGYLLGEVADIDVDSNIWHVAAFYVSLSEEATAELNFKKPFLRKIVICLPTQLIQAVGDVITLTEAVRSLKGINDKEICVNHTKIEGKKVIGAQGYVVGEVEGLDVDPSNWQVTGLFVGLTEEAATELGFKIPVLSKVVVIIPISAVSAIGNFITLNKAIEDLASLVECIKSCKKQD